MWPLGTGSRSAGNVGFGKKCVGLLIKARRYLLNAGVEKTECSESPYKVLIFWRPGKEVNLVQKDAQPVAVRHWQSPETAAQTRAEAAEGNPQITEILQRAFE